MSELERINDKIFKKIFKNTKNAADFLKKALPREIKERLDFSTIEIDPTNYVSDEFKEGYSDVVIKAEMKSKADRKISTDIYFIMEHKTEGKVKVFIQILKYMYMMWEQDIKENKPLRVIIPIVFYHGKKKWKIPGSFVDQFDVDEEVKKFLLNFRYILFDTNPWNFRDERNEELKNNVFLFTALVLMKAAFKNDMETIRAIFNFWYEKGFVRDKDSVMFFLSYISHTQEINREQLKRMLDESKIDGGDIMQTLAQQLKREGKREGKKEGIKETAKRMLLNDFSVEQVITATGLTEKQVKALMN